MSTAQNRRHCRKRVEEVFGWKVRNHHIASSHGPFFRIGRLAYPDKRPDDRAVYSDVLKVATKDQFKTVRHGPRVPVVHDLGD